jgi:aryl-alcohol dehydrogenase-like predicted oxidoreductase
MAAWEFQTLQNIAEKNGWHKFISMQNYYNLLYREEEREMVCLLPNTNSPHNPRLTPHHADPLLSGHRRRPHSLVSHRAGCPHTALV